MPKNAIEISNLCVKLDGRNIINRLSVDVEKEGCLALLGPSGSGKSTLLKTIAGLVRPERGSVVKIYGDEMWNVLPEERPVSMLFQKPAMFEEQTVETNALYGMLRIMDRSDALKEIEELAGLFRFPTRKLKEKYMHLSGGEQQKAAFIRIFGSAKEIVLLDEPIQAAFDLHQRRELLQSIKYIIKRKKLTAVVVTHEFSEAAFLCEKVMVLFDGESTVGNLREMYTSPNRQRLARVMGYGNELKADLILDQRLREKEFPLHIYPNPPHFNADVAFIRPHDIKLKAGHGFKIMEMQFFGSCVRVILKSEGGNTTIEAEISKNHNFTLNQSVMLEAEAKDIIYFNRDGVIPKEKE